MHYRHLSIVAAILIALMAVVFGGQAEAASITAIGETTLLPEVPPVGHPGDRVHGGAGR